MRNLPDDIIYYIANFLQDRRRDLNSFSQTSRGFHQLLNPLVYRYKFGFFRWKDPKLFADRKNQVDLSSSYWWNKVNEPGTIKHIMNYGIKHTEGSYQSLFRSAIYFRKEKIVEYLISINKFQPNTTYEFRGHKSSHLCAAIYGGSVPILEMILKLGNVQPSFIDRRGRNAISYAVAASQAYIVDRLLEDDQIDPDVPDIDDRTPLEVAITYSAPHMVQALLSSGRVNVNRVGSHGMPLLCYASILTRSKHSISPETIQMLLETGHVDSNVADSLGKTPLIHLSEARGNNGKAIQMLLEVGKADPNIQTGPGRTALWWAIHKNRGRGRLDALASLLECPSVNPNIRDSSGKTILMKAVSENWVDVVEVLLNCDLVDVNATDNGMRTAFSIAASCKSLHVIDLFYDMPGVDVNIPDVRGYSSLMWAILFSNVGWTKYFIAPGRTNVDLYNYEGYTALMMATIRRSAKRVGVLLNFGMASPNLLSQCGKTALHLAMHHTDDVKDCRSVQTIAVLLSSEKLDPNARDNDGLTPLMYACRSRCYQCTKACLSSIKVDVQAKDKNGRTALYWAIENHSPAKLVLLMYKSRNRMRESGQG